ncbi:hypothetical protein [Taibaiella koreensis]|uniref:hypothetical protein n=1 Tax=Taibaiella koreensis TaxID=1268548 RepID=UPI000E59DEA5|nr:hypothetical protein [Taibaiella koreensis]
MAIILSGIAGTFIMTMFVWMVGAATGYQLAVPRILGTLFTFTTTPSGKVSNRLVALIWGNLLHYAIGIFFSMVYALCLARHSLTNGILGGIAFGAIAGIVAVATWLLLLKLHPLTPRIRIGIFLCAIYLGHIVFGIVLALIHYLYSGYF